MQPTLRPEDIAAIRQRSCTSKRSYIRLDSARAVARMTPRKDGVRASAYRCPFCDLWHVGHKPRGARRRKYIDLRTIPLTTA